MIQEREAGVPGPIMSIDSASVYCDAKAIHPGAMRRRLGTYVDIMRQAQWERVGVSLQPAFVNANGLLVEHDPKLQVTSGDLPGVMTAGGLAAVVKDRLAKKNGTDKLSRLELAGRLAFSARKGNFSHVVRRLLKNTMKTASHGTVLRADSGMTDNPWIVKKTVAAMLETTVDQDKSAESTLAIEINRRAHPTVSQYLTHILRLREKYGDMFAVSFDTAHMAQENGNGQPLRGQGVAEDVFTDVLRFGDREGFGKPIIALVELNPVDMDGMSHVPLDRNVVNWGQIMEAWDEHGKGPRYEDRAPLHFAFEPHPRDFPRSRSEIHALVDTFDELRSHISV